MEIGAAEMKKTRLLIRSWLHEKHILSLGKQEQKQALLGRVNENMVAVSVTPIVAEGLHPILHTHTHKGELVEVFSGKTSAPNNGKLTNKLSLSCLFVGLTWKDVAV